ncbi:hypothetical protein HYU82_02895 [Candidatus Saccharibacteria bacterium]|nr:hypothetical protein [Candidatus Saccharibacteria bacterium]
MSEITTNRRPTKESNKHPKMMAAVLGATVLAAVGVNAVRENHSPEQPAINAPHKVYIARPGDSEWSIGTRAYPDIDPREAQDLIDQQNPNQDHLVTPGQEYIFGPDAEIGNLAGNSADSSSAPNG